MGGDDGVCASRDDGCGRNDFEALGLFRFGCFISTGVEKFGGDFGGVDGGVGGCFSKGSDDTVLDLYSWKYNSGNGLVPSYQNDFSTPIFLSFFFSSFGLQKYLRFDKRRGDDWWSIVVLVCSLNGFCLW